MNNNVPQKIVDVFTYPYHIPELIIAVLQYVVNGRLNKIAFNTLRPRQDGLHFPDDILQWILLNENV